MSESRKIAIRRLRIEKLFGKFNYNIPEKENDTCNLSNLIILYGDNGSGKTTILNLIYHLLSTSNHKGHRSFIAQIPFKKFEIELSNSLKIKIERKEPKIIGSYRISLFENDVMYESAFLKTDIKTNAIRISDEKPESKKLDRILDYIEKIGIRLYFLHDERTFESDFFPNEDERLSINKKNVIISQFYDSNDDVYIDDLNIRNRIRENMLKETDTKNVNLLKSIQRAENWINSNIIKASQTADIDVNNIYLQIFSSLSNLTKKNDYKDFQQIIERLEFISRQCKKYSEYNIIPPLELDKIINTIRNAPENLIQTAGNILNPYIDSIEARLKNLETMFLLLSIFIQNINNFYTYKKVVYLFNEGFKIISENMSNLGQKSLTAYIQKKSDEDEPDNKIQSQKTETPQQEPIQLSPSSLSSGEKQLLTLFCSILPARDTPSIFIIDEPEISLNIKWQRNLIQTLLELTKESQVQFIIATHSIELLTQFKAFRTKLTNGDPNE